MARVMSKSMLKLIAALLLTSMSLGGPAVALQLTDLSKVDTKALAGKWSAKPEGSNRLVLSCGDCRGLTAIDVQLSKAPAGMEDRVRAGKTTAQTMLDICRKNAAKSGTECYGLKKSNLKSAVGFVSDVKISDNIYANTYTLYQDDQLLLMRCIAGSRAEAKRIGALAFQKIAPQIVR